MAGNLLLRLKSLISPNTTHGFSLWRIKDEGYWARDELQLWTNVLKLLCTILFASVPPLLKTMLMKHHPGSVLNFCS